MGLGRLENMQLPLKRDEICQIIPHREPFLFVDELIEFEDRKRAVGIKYVKESEFYFPGHFPGRPIMPGVIMLESLAQVGAIFARLSTGGVAPENLVVFSGAEDVRFRRPVLPGDVLRLEMDLIRSKFGHWKMQGRVLVKDELAVSGILMATEVA